MMREAIAAIVAMSATCTGCAGGGFYKNSLTGCASHHGQW